MSRLKLRRCPALLMCVLTLPLLTGCGTSSDSKLQLPDFPLGLKVCANMAIPAIPGERGSPITKEQASDSLAEQRAFALSKDRCVKDNQSWYLDLRKGIAK